jgi:uncharacterized protein (TIGR03437 family)
LNISNPSAAHFGAWKARIYDNGKQIASTTFTVSAPASSSNPVVVNAGGVVSNASYAARVSNGSLISIFGNYMAGGTSGGFSLPLPVSYNGTTVLVNGVAAPLLYVSPTLINAQLPFGTPGGSVRVVVSYGSTSAAAFADVTVASPGIYYLISGSANVALAQHVDGSLVTFENPASAGEILIVYGTGIGPVSPGLATGEVAGGYPSLSISIVPHSATINGSDAPIDFMGLTPGLLGVMQINMHVPANAPSGNLPVFVTIDGIGSQSGLVLPVR